MTEVPLYVSNPEKWLNDLTKENDFVGIVIFEGSWCKYDKHYLHKLGKYNKEKMKAEGLKLIAWTSEGPEGAKKADKDWGLTEKYGFAEVLGDSTNALAKYLVDDCILEHLGIKTPEELGVKDQITEGTYPNGIVQPGMIWYAHHGSLVLQWESKGNEGHGFFTAVRPNPPEIWEQVLKRKHALDKGEAVMPVHGNELKKCTSEFEVKCMPM